MEEYIKLQSSMFLTWKGLGIYLVWFTYYDGD